MPNNDEEPIPEGYVPVSISMRPEDVALLDRLATEKKLSRSAFVRQIFGQWLRDLSSKFHPPDAGVYEDAAGNLVHVGLLDDRAKAKVESGEWILKKSF
jgi:hypothetical protein